MRVADLGIQVEVGVRDQGQPLALMHRVLDGVLLADRIAALDASPPFVRFFSLEGDYLGSAIPRGDGPAELTRPLSLGRQGDTILLAAERSRVVRLDSDGGVIATDVEDFRYVRGAAGACRGGLVRLVTVFGAFEPPGALTLARPGEPEDTLVLLDSIRANSRRSHPFLIDGDEEAILFYPEETGKNHLLEVDCVSHEVRAIPIDSLGRQEYFQPQGPGRFGLHPASSPRPAGIAHVEGETIWAIRDEVLGSDGVDSVTVFKIVDAEEQRSLVVQGWFQLLDSADGRLLLTAEEPVSRLLIVLADDLLNAMSVDSSQTLVQR